MIVRPGAGSKPHWSRKEQPNTESDDMNPSQETIALGGDRTVNVEYERTESTDNDYPVYSIVVNGSTVATVGKIRADQWYGTTGYTSAVNQSRYTVTTDLLRRKYGRQ